MTSVISPGTGVQIEMPLFRSKDELAQRLDYLLSILRDRLWHTARDLKVYGFTDRELRELVEHSDGRILSFPGSPGYKLFEAATLEEFQQAEALRNQARRMLSRFFRYRKRYHRGT
jgi:hypothetical protein